MQYQTTVEGQSVDVWTDSATVEAITLRSENHVWTQGGGGYVGPNGGFVSAPQVRSSTTQFKELRVLSDDGSRRSVNLNGDISVIAGDRVSFVYAGETAKSFGKLIGFLNHTERNSWAFPTRRLIRDPKRFKRGWIMAAVALVLLLAFRFEFNNIDRADMGLNAIRHKVEDWNAWDDYARRNRQADLKFFVAQYRPGMDSSMSRDQLEASSRKLASESKSAASAGITLFFLLIAFPIAALIFHLVAMSRFDNLVNVALRREVRALSEVGDLALTPDAAIRRAAAVPNLTAA